MWTLPLYGPGSKGTAKGGGKRRPGCRPVGAATVTRGRALGRVRREFQPRPFPELVSRSFASGVYWREDTRGMKLKRGPMGASRDMECVCDCRGETKAALKGGAAVAQKFECLGGRRRGRGDDSKGDGGPSGPIHGVALGHKASGRDRRGSALRRGGRRGDGMGCGRGDGTESHWKDPPKGTGTQKGAPKAPQAPLPTVKAVPWGGRKASRQKGGSGCADSRAWGGKWRPWKATGEFFHTRRGDGENLGLGVGAHAGLVAA